MVSVNPSGALALQAAQAVAGAQHYPPATLYLVATPIGNLADISLRALHLLQQVDAVACEDTRHSAALLRAYGIERPLLALHQHNEREAAAAVVARLQAGARIAYVSDAGTPGISDPGARLCQAVAAAGLRCVPLPGASSLTALLSVAGWVESEAAPGFVFLGFLPAKGAARERALRRLAQLPQAGVLLEAPHRIPALARELAALGARRLTVGRELTKQFEEIATLPCADLPAWLAAKPQRLRGEFALLLHPPEATPATDPEAGPDAGLGAEALRVLDLLLPELPLKTAVRLCAEITGAPRNALYEAALQRQALQAS
ncbi:MAG: 16S rRNA (cytidine(1402)-2'-O)-methyltransferase [Comamonadaceae bacterium 32-67-11]|nr:MAG: 16S rRNA (cytidine(1402)-2'-O)-methyltransferase [Comamonadaceae bacterium 32-67-11]